MNGKCQFPTAPGGSAGKGRRADDCEQKYIGMRLGDACILSKNKLRDFDASSKVGLVFFTKTRNS